MTCRACRGLIGDVVLDLGRQPACDYFPPQDEPGPDRLYPLQMWLCRMCHLAQLVGDPTVAEEPKAKEPAALVAQAADAVSRVATAGWLPRGAQAAEYGSPHGGSWLNLLQERGLANAAEENAADVVLDCFGLMHEANQNVAMVERVSRVAEGGVLLLQYHSLATIVQLGQWNALRHGHYAYFSTLAVARLLTSVGFTPRMAWRFPLYGGTILLAATRDADGAMAPNKSVLSLLAEDEQLGVHDPKILRSLEDTAQSSARALYDWLRDERAAGRKVMGYGAASRTVALLCRASVNRDLLSAIADASPAKQGLRMPGTDIPIVGPGELVESRPDAVVLFLSDLRDEVRVHIPEVEATGSRWVNVESLLEDKA